MTYKWKTPEDTPAFLPVYTEHIDLQVNLIAVERKYSEICYDHFGICHIDLTEERKYVFGILERFVALTPNPSEDCVLFWIDYIQPMCKK